MPWHLIKEIRYVCLCVCLSVGLYVSVSLSVCLFVCLSVCLFVCLALSVCLCLSACLSVSVCLSQSQDIIRRANNENGHAAATRKEKKMKFFRRACFRRVCIKMCSSCDRIFWEMGHKGKNFCSVCHNSQQIRSQF